LNIGELLIWKRNSGWKIGDPSVKTGFENLEKAIKVSFNGPEFIANLAHNVTTGENSANIDAVLSHLFAVEFEDEGVLFQVRDVAKAVKFYAPNLWSRYLSLTDSEKKQKGITTKIL
jgi:hypothetical protein